MRGPLRRIAAHPPPVLHGLHGRHWRLDQGRLRGRYLFEDQSSLEAFERAPELDPAYGEVRDLIGNEPVHKKLNEDLAAFRRHQSAR